MPPAGLLAFEMRQARQRAAPPAAIDCGAIRLAFRFATPHSGAGMSISLPLPASGVFDGSAERSDRPQRRRLKVRKRNGYCRHRVLNGLFTRAVNHYPSSLEPGPARSTQPDGESDESVSAET